MGDWADHKQLLRTRKLGEQDREMLETMHRHERELRKTKRTRVKAVHAENERRWQAFLKRVGN